jgi:hypothetical protein
MQGLYYWRDRKIYLILFRVSHEKKNQHVSWHDDDGKMPSSGNLSIFFHRGQPVPKNIVRKRYLTDIEFRQSHNYVLFNCAMNWDFLFSKYNTSYVVAFEQFISYTIINW